MNINRDVCTNDHSLTGFLYGFFPKDTHTLRRGIYKSQLTEFYRTKNIWEVFIDPRDFTDGNWENTQALIRTAVSHSCISEGHFHPQN